MLCKRRHSQDWIFHTQLQSRFSLAAGFCVRFMTSSRRRREPRQTAQLPVNCSRSQRSAVTIIVSKQSIARSKQSSSCPSEGATNSFCSVSHSMDPLPALVGMMLQCRTPFVFANSRVLSTHSTDCSGRVPGGCNNTNARRSIPKASKCWQASEKSRSENSLLSKVILVG